VFTSSRPTSILSVSLAAVALLVLGAPSADALERSLAVTSANVAINGELTSAGGTPTAPTLVAPSSVRILSRALCVGDPMPAPCPTWVSGGIAVSIAWYDISTDDVRTHLERRLDPDGPWTVRETIDEPVTYGHSIVDYGDLTPDTRYCYRLTVEGSTGETRTSSEACVVTPVANDPVVTRAQLQLFLADVPGAGTDGRVSVALTEPPGNLPTGNFTGIFTPRNDLYRGSWETYELNVTGVQTFHDITRISIASGSTDEFCVESMQLIINDNENNGTNQSGGAAVFYRYFGDTADTCRWVGGIHGGLLIDHDELRASSLFINFDGSQTLLTSIGKEEMEARLEPIIGTLLWERYDIAWDSDQTSAVSVTHAVDGEGRDALHVHLDLEGLVEGPNPEVDVDFLITPFFEPTDSDKVWNLVLKTSELSTNVDFSWWVDVLSGLTDPICAPVVAVAEGTDPILDCVSELESYIEDRIEDSFDAPSKSMAVTLPDGCVEPDVNIASDVSVRFSCKASKRSSVTLDRSSTTLSGSRLLLR
jgi:hypothetical protein